MIKKRAFHLAFFVALSTLVFSSTSSGLSTTNVFITSTGTINYIGHVSSSVYYIAASSDSNSVVTPSGVIAVDAGSSLSFSMLPSEGYSISSVIVDSVNLGPITDYTFTAVDNNHTISVSSVFKSTSELKTALIIYGTYSLTPAQQADVANFDLLVTSYEMAQDSLAGIKALNPNILIFVYIDVVACHPIINTQPNPVWDEVNSHEDWFIHDNAGNRVINTYWWGWYLMDVRSGWRDFYVQRSNELLSSPYVDGIYGDDVINEIRWTIEAGVFSDAVTNTVVAQADFPSSYLDNWKSDMVVFLNYVKNGINGKFLINSEERATNSYLVNTNVDGKMSENFVGTTSESRFLEYVNGMVSGSATGKIFLAESTGGWEPYTPSQHSGEFCYASALLAMNGENCYFGYNYGAYYGYEQGTDYMPTMTSNLGSPSGAYYKIQSVYQRDFTNGKVVVNPSDASYTVNLGGNYQLLDGTTVSSISLGPWSGEILSALK